MPEPIALPPFIEQFLTGGLGLGRAAASQFGKFVPQLKKASGALPELAAAGGSVAAPYAAPLGAAKMLSSLSRAGMGTAAYGVADNALTSAKEEKKHMNSPISHAPIRTGAKLPSMYGSPFTPEPPPQAQPVQPTQTPAAQPAAQPQAQASTPAPADQGEQGVQQFLQMLQGFTRQNPQGPATDTSADESQVLAAAGQGDSRAVGSGYEANPGFLEKVYGALQPTVQFLGGGYDPNYKHKQAIDMQRRELELQDMQNNPTNVENAQLALSGNRITNDQATQQQVDLTRFRDELSPSPGQTAELNYQVGKQQGEDAQINQEQFAEFVNQLPPEAVAQIQSLSPEVLQQMMMRTMPGLFDLETLEGATGGPISELGHSNEQLPPATGNSTSMLLEALLGGSRPGGKPAGNFDTGGY